MAERPLNKPLPADLPEDWTDGQTVAPQGADVGLSERHGYNYLMASVNAAARAINTLNEGFDAVAGLNAAGVVSFKGRVGAVVPQAGDYTAAQVGAVPTSRTVNGKALSSNITLSASDVGARPSSWTPTAADVGAVAAGGTAAAASRLSTARTIRTNLASASAASFDGTASVTPGVTGILPVSNGGTGKSTALITCGTTDLTAGSSALATGCIYLVYE